MSDEERRNKILKILTEGRTTLQELRERTGLPENTLKKDLDALMQDPITSPIVTGRIRSPEEMEREEKKRELKQHMTSTPAEEHPAYKGDILSFYKNHLGTDSTKTVHDYFHELIRDKEFRESYEALLGGDIEARKKVLALWLSATPKDVLAQYTPDYLGKRGIAQHAIEIGKLDEHKIKSLVNDIHQIIKESNSAQEEKQRLYNLYVEHGITPYAATLLSRAMGLSQRTEQSMLDNKSYAGFDNRRERTSYGQRITHKKKKMREH